jgi:hypothetical protein
MVGKRERGEFHFMGFLHEPVQTARAIEQRVLGVQVQMDKVGVRHRPTLPLRRKGQQGTDIHKAPSGLQ